MKTKVLLAIGTGLTITATVALAQKLLPNHEPVPVPFLPAAPEASGEPIRCTARGALAGSLLALAHVRLDVTPDQEPAWTHFAQTFQQALQPIEALCRQVQPDAALPDTLSSLIERKERSTEVTLQVLTSVRLAVSDLESSLRPEQKQRLVELAVEFFPLSK